MRQLVLISLAVLAGCKTQSEQAANTTDVAAMVKADDPAACANPLAITTALAAAHRPYRDAVDKGMPAVRFDTISATGVDKQIHEITCSATAHVEVPLEQSFSIKYKLRPSLDAGGGFVAEVFAEKSFADALAWNVLSWTTKRSSSSSDRPTAELTPDAGEVEADEPAVAVIPEGKSFQGFPVPPATGPFAIPTFEGSNSTYRDYRTRIVAAAREGADFAGNYKVLSFGCGTSCRFVLIIDGNNGNVVGAPFGGEDTPNLSIRYDHDSRLMKANWQSSWDPKTCEYAEYNFIGSDFEKLSGGKAPGECPVSED